MKKILGDKVKEISKIGKILLISCLSSLFLLLVLSLIMLKTDISDECMKGLVLGIYIISCLIGGLLYGKVTSKKRYLAGIIIGIGYYIVLLILSIVFQSPGIYDWRNIVTVLAICIFSGMLGGMICPKQNGHI